MYFFFFFGCSCDKIMVGGSMVKISVIVTVYNIDKYINNCLKSILNQTYKNFEVLIINDGSTDNSQKIIDKYVKKDNRFKSFIKENSGIADSRNYGISKVNGDYFIFIDGDDSINSELLERLSQVISNHDYDLIKYNAKKISPNREDIDENCFFENIDGEEAFLKLFNNS